MSYNINKARHGAENANATLTEEAVKAMRAVWNPKGRGGRKHKGPSITELAKQYGVSYGTAWNALKRATYWKVA